VRWYILCFEHTCVRYLFLSPRSEKMGARGLAPILVVEHLVMNYHLGTQRTTRIERQQRESVRTLMVSEIWWLTPYAHCTATHACTL